MFYHSRPLKSVEYGKVGPAPIDAIDPDFANAYRWLAQYCGFFPQVWLSRSRSAITGYSQALQRDQVLFGFETIKGFPVDYDSWCLLLNPLINAASVDQSNRVVEEAIRELVNDPQAHEHPVAIASRKLGGDTTSILQSVLFVENDQVVVPRLNLKSAKQIVCRNEFQKKTLRRMGFIEDRIIVRRIYDTT